MAVTIALHVAAFIVLYQYEPVRSVLSQAVPIMVSLIAPVVEKPQDQPKPLPVKARIQQPKPLEPQQLITAASETPTPELAPTPPPIIQSAPPRQPVAAAAALAPAIPPNFNADYLDNPPPAYPPLARRMGEQGKVILRVLVNAKGSADKVELKTSSGSHRLDEAALETVKHWRFVPAKQGDQPVAAWVLIPITFTLKG